MSHFYVVCTVLVLCFLELGQFVATERISKQDGGPSNAATMDKMDAMIYRLDQLERSVNTLRAQCSCDSQKFLGSEGSSAKNLRSSTPLARMCSQLALNICERPGVSEISMLGKQIRVFCGSERWIVVLQRFDGSVSFHNKNWAAFKHGFGDLGSKSEFFLGLQHLYDMTSNEKFEMRIDLEDFAGVKKVAQYSDFSVGNEASAFKLGSLGTYSGDAGDSFSYHQGQGFTTLDRDNDAKAIGSCGEEYSSAGWFKSCMEANLMGRYYRGENSNFKEGMYWETFHGPEYSLKSVKMSIRVKC